MTSRHRSFRRWVKDRVKLGQTPTAPHSQQRSNTPVRTNEQTAEQPENFSDPIVASTRVEIENVPPEPEAPLQVLPVAAPPVVGAHVLIDESPLWTSSVQKFEEKEKNRYAVIQDRLSKIRELQGVDNWDTWVNRQPGKSNETTHKWLRKCRTYLPPLATVKGLAQSLSNLDPHKIAPFVTAGAFILVEVGYSTTTPHLREYAGQL